MDRRAGSKFTQTQWSLTLDVVQGTLVEQSKGLCIGCLQSRICRSGFTTPAALNTRPSCLCIHTSTHLVGLMLVGVQGAEVERSVVPEPGACSSGPAGHTTQQPAAAGRAEAPGGPTAGHAAAHTASRQAVKHRVSSLAFTPNPNTHSKHSCHRNMEHLALVECVLNIPLLAHSPSSCM